MPKEEGPRDWSPRGPRGEGTRRGALSRFLGIPKEEIEEIEEIGENIFRTKDKRNYLVVTEKEADEAVKADIEETLWAFNASFIIDHSKLPPEAEEMIQTFQEAKSEGANETMKALITDMDEFVADAIEADGRGHFLSHYDGQEEEQGDFFIYRLN